MSDFHLLLEEEIPRLMRYASALTRDADTAAELVADTVRDALAEQRRCRGNLRVWLLTILHDLRGNPFRLSFEAAAPVADPKAPLTLSQLDRALGQLSEEQRAVILLVGLEGMSYSEAAAILRITLGTMRSRLARGRAALRRAMGVEEDHRVAHAA
ncbi:MAG TPA: sigma factor-like helix-turn-helix DNA-binding protein [Stellaceae bacterium]|nr:sigma factor-like helix-turn-helix DNA-binding protein [Stellaceae bacterium]